MTANGLRCYARYGNFDTLAVGGAYNGGHSCVGDSSGAQCWGSNSSGQAEPPSDLQNVTHLAASSDGTCALTGNTIRCWGFSANAPLEPITDALELRGNQGSFCARSARFLTCWGNHNLRAGRALLLTR